MTVFATVGYPGSGKGEAAEVARALGMPVVVMGDELRAACRARGLPITEANLGRVASGLRAAGGDDVIARRRLPLLRLTHRAYDDVLVDGIRGSAEVECFEAALGEAFHLIAVDAPFEVRLERIAARGRDPTATDAADLRERDRREEGYGMAEAFAAAEHTVDNSGSLAAFRDALRAVLGPGDGA